MALKYSQPLGEQMSTCKGNARWFVKLLQPVDRNIPSETIKNITSTREFHLKAFLISEKVQLLVCIGILLMYLMSVLGNLLIVTLVCLVSHLHTPMYVFLCNLAVQDCLYVSTFLPKLLDITISGNTSISFSGCIAQIFLFVCCIDTEFYLLTFMAYDRYLAICSPLHYALIMNRKLCALLIAVSWCFGFLNAIIFSLLVSNLSFCDEQINNFFCDITIFLKLSCSDITYIIIFIFVEAIVLGWSPFFLILTSYIFIIATILKIKSSHGRSKTFSSCSSHLTVVILFYGTSMALNLKPKSKNSMEIDKLLSMLYIGVVPMVNPLVYSLRNKDVLRAFKSLFKKLK
ncbi:olfactory receptor 13F1-like [Bombina bombina]|uniref:olfactory receptor 13F1-like n=1 Tax=Bombina bombina TaxID=8345 RepID=UPI00235A486D|nr:olfactory receptor 13F1-like [Bombina bombina]